MKSKIYILLLFLIFLSACTNIRHAEKDKNVLTVYSPYPATLIRPILNEFEKQEHVKIEIKRGSTQVLLSNLHQEKPSERGDVFMGGVLSETIDHTEDFVPYQDCSVTQQLDDYRSNNKYVTSFLLMPTVIVVNKDLQGDIAIRGYKDLLQPVLKGHIAYSNPNTTTTGYQHMRAIYSINHQVSDVHQFQNHAMQLSHTSKVIEDVAKGKYYAGLSYEQDARTWKNKGYPISIIYPTEGTMLNVDGIALVKNAHPHPKRKKLVQYLTSRSVQQRLVAEFDAKSIRKDVTEQNDQSIANLKNIPLIPKSKLPNIQHHKFLEMIQ
ncbi:extracellular solute-binding protein [Staphylococcus schweitzeri]|uniref:extracellular solute-binding protein n=1 Tax=Staphylococcus schweitzeri TaxID=1654388 RepID=UPI000507C832|nr:extracellular solute-binding protein [Staphylococcus schweitzeri]CDR61680.1 putative lipoprotein [Staphylococcus schweitzeri]